MNVKQKLGYMLIGCLFTIVGYILASLGGGAHTQQIEQVLDKIVCRELQVVNKEGNPVAGILVTEDGGAEIVCRQIKVISRFGKTMAIIKESTVGGWMTLHNAHGEVITLIQPGRYNVYARPGRRDDISFDDLDKAEQGKELLHIGPTAIAISGWRGQKTAVELGATIVEGVGFINVNGEKGKNLISIGAVKGRPNDGLINIYNHKGEWRSITAVQ